MKHRVLHVALAAPSLALLALAGSFTACGDDGGAGPIAIGNVPVDAGSVPPPSADDDATAPPARVDAGQDASPPPDAGGDAALDAAPDGTADAAVDASDAGAVYASCKAARDANAGAPDGVYVIDPDGPGVLPATPLFCDMTRDGGGWTLALLVNSLHGGDYATFGVGLEGVDALAVDPKVAAAVAPAPAALAGWLDLNTTVYSELVLEGLAAGASTFRSVPVLKSALRIAFGQPGYLLYNDANGYFWCGGPASYTNDGIGQVNVPAGAPLDCKGHTSLGAGWDFGGAAANSNLTMCGGGSRLVKAGPSSGFVSQGSAGAAHAIWVR